MRQKIFSWLPPGYRYFKQESIIRLPKPWLSEIHLKSADSGREKFQGAGLTAAWFDEEPKGIPGEEIFGEVYARRKPGVPLRIFMTFTPLQGLSWSYRRLWDEKSLERYPGVETFLFDLHDCSVSLGGFLTDEEISTIEGGYSEWEREARVHGKYFATGSPYFSPRRIQETRDKCEVGKKHSIELNIEAFTPVVKEDESGKLVLYRPPARGRDYICGIDSAGGVGRDSSVAVVFDAEDKAIVAQYASNTIQPDLFATTVCLPLGLHYNNALLVVETNGEYGGMVLSNLKARYPNLFMRQEWDKIALEYKNEYGFRTTERTRGRVFATLAKYLREGTWTPTVDLLMEMAQMNIDPSTNRVDHPDGCHDDIVMAAGIALAVMDENPVVKLPNWRRFVTHASGPQELKWMAY